MLQRLKTIWRRIRTGEVASEGESRLFYEGFGHFVFREGEFSTR
jgi:hypothetical protein